MFQGRTKLHNLLEHQNAKMSLRGCQHARTIFLFMKLHFMKPKGSLRIHPDRISWRGLVFVILRHGAVWILLADSGAAEKLGNGGEKVELVASLLSAAAALSGTKNERLLQ